MNTLFQILYLVTILYLVVLYFSLFKNVTRLRRGNKTPLGYNNEDLHRAIRAHSNFCETVPFCLLLSLILYFNSYHYISFASVLMLCIGRKVHSDSILNSNEDLAKRRLGMRITAISFLIIIIGILFHICDLIYYFTLANFNTTI